MSLSKKWMIAVVFATGSMMACGTGPDGSEGAPAESREIHPAADESTAAATPADETDADAGPAHPAAEPGDAKGGGIRPDITGKGPPPPPANPFCCAHCACPPAN